MSEPTRGDRADRRPRVPRMAIAAALGTAAIWAGAQVTVPMEPVPMTLQTLAVLLAGGLGGPAVGFAAGALYLVAGIAGAPVFADATVARGLDFLDLKSGGYIVAFAPAAALAGVVPERLPALVLRMLAAHAVILFIGGLWLAVHIGARSAVEYGVRPFLIGAMVKSVAAALVIAALRRRR